MFNIKEAACAAVIVRPERVAVSSRAVSESSPADPGADDSCGAHTRARTRSVPPTRGQRPFCGDDAWRGGREFMRKIGGLFFAPGTICGNFGVSRSPDSPKLVSRSWKGYRIPPGCFNESVEER